jgi:hypothetical protein
MNRWALTPDLFARRVSINDVPGFFSKQLQIEPGIRSVIIDGGRQLGEVPPDTYTLSSFSTRLHDWWNQKQCDVIMVRGEDQILQILSAPVLTSDYLQVQFRTRIAVQLRDVMLFHQKLMGNSAQFTVEQLQRAIAPILSGFVHSFVSGLPMDQLRAPDTWQKLDAFLEDNLALYLQRYGLAFVQVLTLSIVHPEYDAELTRRGETVLMEMAAETDRRRAKLAEDSAWEQIRQKDKTQQVQAALAGLDIDQEQQQLDQVRRRVQIRSSLREAVLSDKFDKLQTAADLANFVRELDREKLLSDDEHQQLQVALQQQAQDRAAARQQLLKRLALEQQLDLQLLADECSHRLSLQRRRAELELASIDDTEADRQWRRKLSHESEQAEHDRTERWKAWQDRVRKFRSYWQEKRDDEIDVLLHETRRDQLLGEAELERLQREIRMQMMQDEQRVRSAKAQADEQWIADEYARIGKQRQQEIDLEYRRKADELAYQQAERAAKLQRDIAAGQLQEVQMRLAMQQENLKVMQENERLVQELHFRHKQETDRQRLRAEEWTAQRRHNREMEKLRLEKEAKESERRDNQAHQLRLEQAKNDRFRDARGQNLDVLIFGADPEQARVLRDVDATRQKTAADIEQARSAANQAQARADADRQQSLVQELLKTLPTLLTSQPGTARDEELRRRDEEIIAAKDQHIASIEAASDKRDASVQQTMEKLLEALANRAAPTSATPAPANVPQTTAPPTPATVIINQGAPFVSTTGTPGENPGSNTPGTFRTPGPNEKRCPYCQGIIALESRFCSLCGAKQ